MGCDRALWGGGGLQLRHTVTRNSGKSHDGGVAGPWSATGEGVASAPVRVARLKNDIAPNSCQSQHEKLHEK